jgi:DNA/RNA-binding domain of Phe-tRNA-synthetase-like protein
MSELGAPPFEVDVQLPGWSLFWAELELADEAQAAQDALASLRAATTAWAREHFDRGKLAEEPTVAELRRLFRDAGTDPTRYRPASEALLRRVLKGDELPGIHPFVDLNNCLSLRLAVPCCVMAEGSFEPPMELRVGREGESYESLKGPFRLEGRPLLTDSGRPCDAPITGSERVKVRPDTRRVWLVAYLPAATLEPAEADRVLRELAGQAPGIRLLQTASR